jgi:hypothetical protein
VFEELQVCIKLFINATTSGLDNRLKVSDATKDFKFSLIALPTVKFFELVDKSFFNL